MISLNNDKYQSAWHLYNKLSNPYYRAVKVMINYKWED